MSDNNYNSIEKLIETLLFQSRWLLAPLYIGLAGALLVLMMKFVEKFIKLTYQMFELSSTDLVLQILGLIDVVLIANLLLIIIFSGYENFVSKIDAIQGHVDRPDWMGKVDYTGLKIKLIGSIVAISSIELLKAFINTEHASSPTEFERLKWLVLIHLTFVIAGVLFAIMERILHPPHVHHHSSSHNQAHESTH